MNTIKSLVLIMALTSLFSCSSDDEEAVENNPVAGLSLVSSFEANGHAVELYAENSRFTTGYNEVFIRIRDRVTGRYFPGTEISWMPVMYMADRKHSCPKSKITLTENNTISKGFLIFQMPGNAEEYWGLTINYTIDGIPFEAGGRVEVEQPQDGRKRISVFEGNNGARYVLAMMAPVDPEVKINDFVAGLYVMENMMSFPVAEYYKITVDPRMPGMGNHGSPNNKDLSYDALSGLYRGKLSLTMTGYWKINLKLLNADNEVVKGEDITEETPGSSLYLEVEF